VVGLKFDGVEVFWLGHDCFKLKFEDLVVYTDPFELKEGEPADLILVSHEHFDHCDLDSIRVISKDGTEIVGSEGAVRKIGKGKALEEGEEIEVKGVKIKAVPAYNVNKFRAPGQPFHPRGLGVGFVFELGGLKFYHAGDTDAVPEMSALAEENVDVAMLPISGVYVMTEEEALNAVGMIKPKKVIPMHYGSLEGVGGDPERFKELVEQKFEGIEVVIPSKS